MIDPFANPFLEIRTAKCGKAILGKNGRTGTSFENALVGGSELIGNLLSNAQGYAQRPHRAGENPDRIEEGFRPLDSSQQFGLGIENQTRQTSLFGFRNLFCFAFFHFNRIDLMFM